MVQDVTKLPPHSSGVNRRAAQIQGRYLAAIRRCLCQRRRHICTSDGLPSERL